MQGNATNLKVNIKILPVSEIYYINSLVKLYIALWSIKHIDWIDRSHTHNCLWFIVNLFLLSWTVSYHPLIHIVICTGSVCLCLVSHGVTEICFAASCIVSREITEASDSVLVSTGSCSTKSKRITIAFYSSLSSRGPIWIVSELTGHVAEGNFEIYPSLPLPVIAYLGNKSTDAEIALRFRESSINWLKLIRTISPML